MGTIKDVNDRLTETIIALNNRFQEFSYDIKEVNERNQMKFIEKTPTLEKILNLEKYSADLEDIIGER